jgi:hypothetical protein
MPIQSLIPPEDRIYAWIEEVFRRGLRRPGHPADIWTTEFCRERFEEFGLENVRLEPVTLPRWEPRSWSLRVWRDDPGKPGTLELACFPLPHSAPTEGLEAEIVEFDAESPNRVSGKISLYDLPLLRSRQTAMTGLATSAYDPEGVFAEASYPGDSRDYYVPYDAVERPLPGVWISGSDGRRVREMMAEGPVRARLVVDSGREEVTTHNVVGELPGADDETVIIGSHHDGPWSSAVEDGSGIAMVLAQAQYWSRLPRAERPHRLLFLLNSGHMAGGAGAKAFIETHREELESVVLEVHLEHAANECVEENGVLALTGRPEVRWWFTSRIPQLESAVQTAIEAEELNRSLVLPPTAFGPRPTTDGGDFHLAGVPLMNFLTAPFYLFDSRDTMDKIHRESLVPVTRAAIRIIEWTAGRTATQMRAQVIT